MRRRLLCLLMLCGLLSGCGNASGNAPAVTTEQIVPEQASQSPVSGTMSYSFGNTIKYTRMCDYYIDSAQDIQVFVDYPEYFQSDGNDIAELIRLAAYNGWTIEDLAATPNTNMTIDYEITRADAQYFSVAFLSFYFSRGNAHPSSEEYAVTIDRATGSPVLLSDILDFSDSNELAELISEEFTPLGGWVDLPALDELAACYIDNLLFDEQHSFYLTDDSLCLIIHYFRYDFVLEAPLSSLPLKHPF